MKSRLLLTLFFALPLGIIGLMLATDHNQNIGNIFLALLAISLATFACVLLYKKIAFYNRSIRTIGELTGWHEAMRPDDSGPTKYWYPKISFSDATGMKYEFTSGAGFNPKPQYELGNQFIIRYDPTCPDKAAIDGFIQLWLPPAAFFLLSAAAAFALLKRLNII